MLTTIRDLFRFSLSFRFGSLILVFIALLVLVSFFAADPPEKRRVVPRNMRGKTALGRVCAGHNHPGARRILDDSHWHSQYPNHCCHRCVYRARHRRHSGYGLRLFGWPARSRNSVSGRECHCHSAITPAHIDCCDLKGADDLCHTWPCSSACSTGLTLPNAIVPRS